MKLPRSPCPNCATELFWRRLKWQKIEVPETQRRTTVCPSCGIPLQTDPKAHRTKVLGLLMAYPAFFVPLDIFSLSLLKGALGVCGSLLIVYAIFAFPYIRQKSS